MSLERYTGHNCVPLEKLMSINVLNINLSLVRVEISNSYCNGNAHHGRIASAPHVLGLYGNGAMYKSEH